MGIYIYRRKGVCIGCGLTHRMRKGCVLHGMCKGGIGLTLSNTPTNKFNMMFMYSLLFLFKLLIGTKYGDMVVESLDDIFDLLSLGFVCRWEATLLI
ncbi:hypothetical protein Hanom_Chr08g00739801 [Helianthus anomalus]